MLIATYKNKKSNFCKMPNKKGILFTHAFQSQRITWSWGKYPLYFDLILWHVVMDINISLPASLLTAHY